MAEGQRTMATIPSDSSQQNRASRKASWSLWLALCSFFMYVLPCLLPAVVEWLTQLVRRHLHAPYRLYSVLFFVGLSAGAIAALASKALRLPLSALGATTTRTVLSAI